MSRSTLSNAKRPRPNPQARDVLARVLALLKRCPLVAFFVLSYAIAWPGWWLEASSLPYAWLGSIAGYFGPAISAILVSAIAGGREEVEALLARLFRWRVPIKWYLAAVLVPAGSVLAVVAVLALTGKSDPDAAPLQLGGILPELAFVLVVGSLYGTLVAAGEELGWRGYALPRLLERHSALLSSIVIGVFWGLWHLPLRFLYPPGPGLVDSLLYGLAVDLAAVIYTWMFQGTGGSVLIASLFHAVYDVALVVTGQLPGVPFSYPLHVLVLAIFALVITCISPRRHDGYREEIKEHPISDLETARSGGGDTRPDNTAGANVRGKGRPVHPVGSSLGSSRIR